MATSLAEIRARLTAQETRQQGKEARQVGDSAIYQHWNMPEGTTATVRFLPDADPTNSFFWIERQIIKLPFNGIKGKDSKQIEVQVPCVEMWGENCPILAEVRPWYKDDSLKDMANRYWKKRSYLFQGFVRSNPITDDRIPENPIRRFVISTQIFNVIKQSLMDPEMESLPTDYDNGLDFRIIKASKGQYADYSTSSWARKETSLTDDELDAIETHGLYNLRDFLPKKPSEAELRIIKDMFEASVEGEAYDPDRWAAYYKPWGLDTGNSTPESAPAQSTSPAQSTPVATPQVSTVFAAETSTVSSSNEEVSPIASTSVASDKAQDILALIRNRKQQA